MGERGRESEWVRGRKGERRERKEIVTRGGREGFMKRRERGGIEGERGDRERDCLRVDRDEERGREGRET